MASEPHLTVQLEKGGTQMRQTWLPTMVPTVLLCGLLIAAATARTAPRVTPLNGAALPRTTTFATRPGFLDTGGLAHSTDWSFGQCLRQEYQVVRNARLTNLWQSSRRRGQGLCWHERQRGQAQTFSSPDRPGLSAVVQRAGRLSLWQHSSKKLPTGNASQAEEWRSTKPLAISASVVSHADGDLSWAKIYLVLSRGDLSVFHLSTYFPFTLMFCKA